MFPEVLAFLYWKDVCRTKQILTKYFIVGHYVKNRKSKTFTFLDFSGEITRGKNNIIELVSEMTYIRKITQNNVNMWSSEVNLEDLILSFQHAGPEDQTQHTSLLESALPAEPSLQPWTFCIFCGYRSLENSLLYLPM